MLIETAKTAFEWFHGGNTLGLVLINGVTGACYDGITPVGLNRNQGAESTLSYYIAYLTMLENSLL